MKIFVKSKVLVRRFLNNRSGNFAIITALCFFPMIGFVGLGVDYSMSRRAKVALDTAVDAAALAAINAATANITQATANFAASTDYIAQGTAAATAVFQANAAKFASANPVLTVNVAPLRGLAMSVTVSYTAKTPNAFAKLFGVPVMNISGTAMSSFTLPKYINIFVVVDVSNSMGIGSTPADMHALYLRTGCQFACHIGTPGQTNWDIAQISPKITLRIDVVKAAVANMIAKGQSTNSGTPIPYIKIGLYTMEDDLKVLSPPIVPNDSLNSLTQLIDIGTENPGESADSHVQFALQTLASDPLLRTSGDGSSASSPQNFVFIMTDGTYDYFDNGCAYQHCIGDYSDGTLASICKTFKNQGATVGVVHTQYYPIYDNDTPPVLNYFYNIDLGAIADNIPVAMQSCASPGFYYLASDGPSINTALQSLFVQATTQSHLTN